MARHVNKRNKEERKPGLKESEKVKGWEFPISGCVLEAPEERSLFFGHSGRAWKTKADGCGINYRSHSQSSLAYLH